MPSPGNSTRSGCVIATTGSPRSPSLMPPSVPWTGRRQDQDRAEGAPVPDAMRYAIVAEAYHDLEQASGRLALIDRLARLFRETPIPLLPTVALLCQGKIAPDFAGVEIGVAERMAARAVAESTGLTSEEVLTRARAVGDLGLATETLLAHDSTRAAGLEAGLEVGMVFDTLHEIAVSAGQGSQGRKLTLFGELLRRATPLEARYLVRTCTGSLRLGIGTATILDALATVYAAADGRLELFTRRLERISAQFPDVVALLEAGLQPREAILEGEVVAADPDSGELRPFQEVMYRRRVYGIAEAVRDVPVSMFCFDLLYADGQDLTRLPYLERRARLAQALTLSPQLRLTTAAQVSDVEALEAAFQQAVADGCEGLLCKSLAPASGYQAGARGWQWIKLKRDYRTELSDTLDLVVVGALYGRGRRAGIYGALLLACYDPDADVFQTVCKCGTGFSDADLAALPAKLAPLGRTERPARVDARRHADVWFEHGMVVEVIGAELTISPTHTAAWGRLQEDAGLALRFPRFTGRYRDDKAPEDATTVEEVLGLFRVARRAPAGS